MVIVTVQYCCSLQIRKAAIPLEIKNVVVTKLVKGQFTHTFENSNLHQFFSAAQPPRSSSSSSSSNNSNQSKTVQYYGSPFRPLAPCRNLNPFALRCVACTVNSSDCITPGCPFSGGLFGPARFAACASIWPFCGPASGRRVPSSSLWWDSTDRSTSTVGGARRKATR